MPLATKSLIFTAPFLPSSVLNKITLGTTELLKGVLPALVSLMLIELKSLPELMALKPELESCVPTNS